MYMFMYLKTASYMCTYILPQSTEVQCCTRILWSVNKATTSVHVNVLASHKLPRKYKKIDVTKTRQPLNVIRLHIKQVTISHTMNLQEITKTGFTINITTIIVTVIVQFATLYITLQSIVQNCMSLTVTSVHVHYQNHTVLTMGSEVDILDNGSGGRFKSSSKDVSPKSSHGIGDSLPPRESNGPVISPPVVRLGGSLQTLMSASLTASVLFLGRTFFFFFFCWKAFNCKGRK